MTGRDGNAEAVEEERGEYVGHITATREEVDVAIIGKR